jgi:hypothetical protein
MARRESSPPPSAVTRQEEVTASWRCLGATARASATAIFRRHRRHSRRAVVQSHDELLTHLCGRDTFYLTEARRLGGHRHIAGQQVPAKLGKSAVAHRSSVLGADAKGAELGVEQVGSGVDICDVELVLRQHQEVPRGGGAEDGYDLALECAELAFQITDDLSQDVKPRGVGL